MKVEIQTNRARGVLKVDGVEIQHVRSYRVEHSAGSLPIIIAELALFPAELVINSEQCKLDVEG